MEPASTPFEKFLDVNKKYVAKCESASISSSLARCDYECKKCKKRFKWSARVGAYQVGQHWDSCQKSKGAVIPTSNIVSLFAKEVPRSSSSGRHLQSGFTTSSAGLPGSSLIPLASASPAASALPASSADQQNIASDARKRKLDSVTAFSAGTSGKKSSVSGNGNSAASSFAASLAPVPPFVFSSSAAAVDPPPSSFVVSESHQWPNSALMTTDDLENLSPPSDGGFSGFLGEDDAPASPCSGLFVVNGGKNIPLLPSQIPFGHNAVKSHVVVREVNCTGTAGPTGACDACEALSRGQSFVNAVSNAQDYTAHQSYNLYSMSGLLSIIAAKTKAAQKVHSRLTLANLKLHRRDALLATRDSLLDSLMTCKVPRILNVLKSCREMGWSWVQIQKKFDDVLVHRLAHYSPTEKQLGTLVAILGGTKCLSVLNQAGLLPSRANSLSLSFEPICYHAGRDNDFDQLDPSALKHVLTEQFGAERQLWQFSVDEVAIQPRVCVDRRGNRFRVRGLCAEHTPVELFELELQGDADNLVSPKLLEDLVRISNGLRCGDFHRAYLWTVLVVRPLQTAARYGVPILVSPSCNQFSSDTCVQFAERLLEWWSDNCEEGLGPLEVHGTDGDNKRRKAGLTLLNAAVQSKDERQSLINKFSLEYPLLPPSLGTLLHGSDPRHIIKRLWRRVINPKSSSDMLVAPGVLLGSRQAKAVILASRMATNNMKSLFNALDAQNVDSAILFWRLLDRALRYHCELTETGENYSTVLATAKANLGIDNEKLLPAFPADERALRAMKIVSGAITGFSSALVDDCSSSLPVRLKALAKCACTFFLVVRGHGQQKMVTNEIFIDLQLVVQAVWHLAIRISAANEGHKNTVKTTLYLPLVGSDANEELFSKLRTMYTGRDFDEVDGFTRMFKWLQLQEILKKNEWKTVRKQRNKSLENVNYQSLTESNAVVPCKEDLKRLYKEAVVDALNESKYVRKGQTTESYTQETIKELAGGNVTFVRPFGDDDEHRFNKLVDQEAEYVLESSDSNDDKDSFAESKECKLVADLLDVEVTKENLHLLKATARSRKPSRKMLEAEQEAGSNDDENQQAVTEDHQATNNLGAENEDKEPNEDEEDEDVEFSNTVLVAAQAEGSNTEILKGQYKKAFVQVAPGKVVHLTRLVRVAMDETTRSVENLGDRLKRSARNWADFEQKRAGDQDLRKDESVGTGLLLATLGTRIKTNKSKEKEEEVAQLALLRVTGFRGGKGAQRKNDEVRQIKPSSMFLEGTQVRGVLIGFLSGIDKNVMPTTAVRRMTSVVVVESAEEIAVRSDCTVPVKSSFCASGDQELRNRTCVNVTDLKEALYDLETISEGKGAKAEWPQVASTATTVHKAAGLADAEVSGRFRVTVNRYEADRERVCEYPMCNWGSGKQVTNKDLLFHVAKKHVATALLENEDEDDIDDADAMKMRIEKKANICGLCGAIVNKGGWASHLKVNTTKALVQPGSGSCSGAHWNYTQALYKDQKKQTDDMKKYPNMLMKCPWEDTCHVPVFKDSASEHGHFYHGKELEKAQVESLSEFQNMIKKHNNKQRHWVKKQ